MEIKALAASISAASLQVYCGMLNWTDSAVLQTFSAYVGFYIFKVLFGHKFISSILIARKRKRERLERSELYQQQWINVPHVFLIESQRRQRTR